MDPLNIPVKFEVRSFVPVPEIIGGLQKFGPFLDTPTFLFRQNFSWACVRMDPVNVSAKFAVRSFSRSCDSAFLMFWVWLQTPNFWGNGRP